MEGGLDERTHRMTGGVTPPHRMFHILGVTLPLSGMEKNTLKVEYSIPETAKTQANQSALPRILKAPKAQVPGLATDMSRGKYHELFEEASLLLSVQGRLQDTPTGSCPIIIHADLPLLFMHSRRNRRIRLLLHAKCGAWTRRRATVRRDTSARWQFVGEVPSKFKTFGWWIVGRFFGFLPAGV